VTPASPTTTTIDTTATPAAPATATTAAQPTAPVRLIDRVPRPLRSIRFRLALGYSLALFAVVAVGLAVVNVLLAQVITDDQSIAITYYLQVPLFGTLEIPAYQELLVDLEQLVNQRAIARLQTLSLAILVPLFPISFAIGWVIAGRMLRPIDRIGAVAREITGSDLSRRIALQGPDDELTRLAGTFDAMLDRLQAGVDAQRHFIEDASHELRNPLAVVSTTLDVALADPDVNTETLREAATVSRRAVERMSRQVDDLLAIARRDGLSAARVPVDIGQLVGEVSAEYEAAAGANGVTIRVLAGNGGLELVGDPVALRQAFGNLLSNAMRYAPAASAVTAAAGRHGGWLWLGVADHGRGIPADRHALVFQRTYRAEDGGSGLGLAIVRQVAEAHGGGVTIVSAPDDGTRVAIWLPASRFGPPEPVTADGIHPLSDPFAAIL
jgi:signal transduction histidine kinase